MADTAMLAGRVVPTATATTWVHPATYLSALVERDSAEGLLMLAEARAAAAEAECRDLARRREELLAALAEAEADLVHLRRELAHARQLAGVENLPF